MSKSNSLPTIASYIASITLWGFYIVVINYCSRGGNIVGDQLSLYFDQATDSFVVRTGVNWILPRLVYGILAFLTGITIGIIMFWRVFVKGIEENLSAKVTPVYFIRYLFYCCALGFIAGFTFSSFDLIDSMVRAISRLQR